MLSQPQREIQQNTARGVEPVRFVHSETATTVKTPENRHKSRTAQKGGETKLKALLMNGHLTGPSGTSEVSIFVDNGVQRYQSEKGRGAQAGNNTR